MYHKKHSFSGKAQLVSIFFSSLNTYTFPSWNNVAAAPPVCSIYEPMAMAGFLGDFNSDQIAADCEMDEDNPDE